MYPCQRGEAIHDGHLQIHENEVVLLLFGLLEALQSVASRGDILVAKHLEDAASDEEVGIVVVDQQDREWCLLYIVSGSRVVLLNLAEKRAHLRKSLVDLVGGVAGSALHLWTIGRVGVTGGDEDIVQGGQLDWSSQDALALGGRIRINSEHEIAARDMEDSQ